MFEEVDLSQSNHKSTIQQMMKYWDQVFDNPEVSLNIDQSGHSLVCYRHVSSVENQYVDWFQMETFEYLLKAVETEVQGKEVLDVGTGVGRWASRLSARGANVTAIDWNERIIELNQRNIPGVNFLVMPCTTLEFPENKFDLVTSVTVLHHIPYIEQQRAIAEICRVTKGGGHILILESIKTSSKSQTVFPHKLDEWLSLFANHGCQPVVWTGYEYSLLLRLMHRLHKRTDSKNMNSIPLLERFVIALSYPLESVCMRFAPLKAAKQAGILFKKA